MILGTISTVDDNNGLQLIIDGEDSATTKKYSYLASYVPSANDRVLIEEIGGSYVIVGKIISEVSNSGIVREATNATNAVNAESATNATRADQADNATVAASCTGNAATASRLSNQGTRSGQIITWISYGYDATIGKYVADVTLSGTQNFVYQ